MSVEFPIQAKEYFDAKAEELLLLLKPRSTRERPGQEKRPDVNIYSEEIPEDQIFDLRVTGEIDRLGKEKAKYFETENGPIGLEGDNFTIGEALIFKLSERSELNKLLSSEFIKETLFGWLEKRYKDEITLTRKFSEYLIEKATEEIKERKVSIPIAFLSIERSFKLGRVIFEYIPDVLFDEIERQIRTKTGNAEGINEGLKQIRKRYQGLVYSSVTVSAEIQKCIEIAKEETEKALMVLRLYCPTVFVPTIPSYFAPVGKVGLPASYLLMFEEKTILPNLKEQIDERRSPVCFFSEEDLTMFKMKCGFDDASELIVKENPTKLEDLLLLCLSLFARGIKSTEFQDRVVFMLVVTETLLLKNTSEPIQASVSQRMAFLTAFAVKERKEIIDIVKEAYKYRSSYLHHGNKKDDFELLQKLQHIVWTGLTNVLKTRDRFSSQDELLGFIEDKILSG